MQNKIDYYGDKDNYIHLKFGDAIKKYNFTKEFREKYPQFVKAYEMYWDGNHNAFKNPFQIVSYVYNNNIPVHFYFNYTDEPAETREEIIEYLLKENNRTTLYDYMLK